MSSTGKRRGLAVTGRSTRARPSAPTRKLPEGDEVRGVAHHPDLVEAAARPRGGRPADGQLHGGAAQPGIGVRAARAVAHGREGDLAPGGGAPVAAAGDEGAAGRAERRRSTSAVAAAIAGRSTNGVREAAARALDGRRTQRRRRGGLPLLGPERAQLRGHVAQLGRDVVVVACHAPSASIISRRRVRPRTIRALTVPIGMPVAALISLWLSSS